VLSGIVQPPQHIANDIKSRMFLVAGPDHGPGRGDGVRPLQHLVPGFGIGFPKLLRLGIDGAQLPLLQGTPLAVGGPSLLLLFRNIKIVLEQGDTRTLNDCFETPERSRGIPRFPPWCKSS
jgi:hypothetical protein